MKFIKTVHYDVIKQCLDVDVVSNVRALHESLSQLCCYTYSLRIVWSMMTSWEALRIFYKSPKKQDRLTTKVPILLPNSNHSKLIDVCCTRWIVWIDG